MVCNASQFKFLHNKQGLKVKGNTIFWQKVVVIQEKSTKTIMY